MLGDAMLRQSRIFGLDVGASSIKLVELARSKSGLELVKAKVVEIDVGSYAEVKDSGKREQLMHQHLQRAINRIALEEKIRQSAVVVSVSGQSVFIRFVKLPKGAKKQLRQVIRYEAQQQIPFPMEEVVWDFHIFEDTDSPEVNVILAAMKKDVVSDVIASLGAAGLSVDVVESTPLGLFNALLFNNTYGKGTVILDIGAETTNLIITENGKLWTRSIPVAGNDITEAIAAKFSISFNEAEELKRNEGTVLPEAKDAQLMSERAQELSKTISSVLTDLLVELNRSIGYYKSQSPGVEFERLIVTGGTSRLHNIGKFLSSNLDIKLDQAQFFNKIRVQPGLDIGAVKDKLGVAIGLALRAHAKTHISMNLLPAEHVRSRVFKKNSSYVYLSAGIALLIIITAGLWMLEANRINASKLQSLQFILNRLEESQKKVDNIEGQIKPVQEKLDLFDSIDIGRTYWLTILHEVGNSIPHNLWLTEVAYNSPQTAEQTSTSRDRRYPGVPSVPSRGVGVPGAAMTGAPSRGAGMSRGYERTRPAAEQADQTPHVLIVGKTNDPDFSEPLNKFLQNLDRSPYFKNVKTISMPRSGRETGLRGAAEGPISGVGAGASAGGFSFTIRAEIETEQVKL
jgi:type IV pilus assembly protein PilM